MKNKPIPKRSNSFIRPLIRAILGVIFGLIAASLLTCHRTTNTPASNFVTPEPVILAQSELNELSGLASSTIKTNVLWGLNDSGNGNYLFAFDKNSGADLGKIEVKGVINVDWEDLAAFTIDGQHWLLIADVGDNYAERQLAHLWLVPEPQANAQGQYAGAVQPAADIAYRYPEGARDVESVDVDVPGRQIIIISKRDPLPRIYSLPIVTASPATVLIPEFLGDIPQLGRPSALDRIRFGQQAEWRFQPTALDIQALPDGSQNILLLTYKQAYLFNKQPQQSWSAILGGIPKILSTPELPQAEALAFDQDNLSYWLTSERLPTPLYRLPIHE